MREEISIEELAIRPTKNECSEPSIGVKKYNFAQLDDDEGLNKEPYFETDFSDSLYDRYSNPNMVYSKFYSINNYIFRYQEGLNTSNTYAVPLGTEEYYSPGKFVYVKSESTEIIVYKLRKQYRVFNIDRQISSISKFNVINEVLRYLVQFQQLNYFYKPNYNLSSVYDDVMVRIQHQTGLVPNMEDIKNSILERSNRYFEKSIENIDPSIDTLKKFVNVLDLGKCMEYYTPRIDGYERKGLLLKAYRKAESLKNVNMINKCIDNMKEKTMFICPDSVKNELPSTGINQIREVVHHRKQEVDYFNLTNFNAKTYSKYKRLFGIE